MGLTKLTEAFSPQTIKEIVMSDRKFSSNPPPGTAKSRTGSPAKSALRRLLILAILIGGLAFLLSDRTLVKAQFQEDCLNVMADLEYDYFICSYTPDYWDREQCYRDAEFTHQMAGAACGMPHYSPQMVPGSGCHLQENADRTYANCMAGTLTGYWQDQYLNYVTYYNDMDIACSATAQSVIDMGCY